MFPNAQNTLITGGSFTTYMSGANDGQKGLISLHKRIAPGAFHNSAERYDPPKCHPQTREGVLNKIMDWVKDAAKLCFFMWLYGPAGTGKSAIAQTIAEMCYREGLLAASFFFSRRAPGRNNEILLITTIVYQLTLSIPEIRERVGKVLEDDPLVLSRSLEAQMEALIVKPLNDVAEDEQDRLSLLLRPRLIIIDGLDECEESKTQRHILDIFMAAVKQLTIPLFLLVASRPDPFIRDAFNEQSLNSLTIRIVLDDTYKPDADIRRFIKSRIYDIKRKHPSLADLHTPWPSELDIELLVQKSSGQFIYASTIMKYLDSLHHWPPDRLDVVFNLSTAGDDNPLAELDLFYHHILSSVTNIDKVIEVFTVLLLVQFWTKTRNIVEDLLFYRRGEVDITLCDLHSLIYVPLPDEHGELRIFHASFPDFLLDRSRSGKFFIDAAQASIKLTRYCLRHFKQPHVMCRDRINLHHLRALFMLHCGNAQPTPELVDDLYNFDMAAHLSFWASEDNVIGIYEHDNKRIISLLMWLESIHHPNRDTNLLQHHLPAIDQWLHSQLESYSSQLLLRQLVAASTFTKFLSEEIVEILKLNLNTDAEYAQPRRHDPLQIYSPKTEYADFYILLSQFLADPLRSKGYFVDGIQYATLAISVARYLASGQKFEDGIDLLAFILPRSERTPELVRVLGDYPLHDLSPDDIVWPPKRQKTVDVDMSISAQGSVALSTVLPEPITFTWIRGERIREWAYGYVYLALNAMTGDVISTVKQVKLHQIQYDSQNHTAAQALRIEIRILRDLNHPNIVKYLGSEESATNLGLFLEYIPGGSVRNFLEKSGKFEDNVTRSFAAQIMCGVQYLHSKRIIHRKLKANNILVEMSGICKISEFGTSDRLAGRLEPSTFPVTLKLETTANICLPPLMAPEGFVGMLRHSEYEYTFKTDIWSCGHIVLEMWTGIQAPHVVDNLILSEEAGDFRDRCFDASPDQRPSATELRKHPYLILPPGWEFAGFN